jgi:hypothetical protein
VDGGGAPTAGDAEAIILIKVWLIGITPMVWRRVLVPAVSMITLIDGVWITAFDGLPASASRWL